MAIVSAHHYDRPPTKRVGLEIAGVRDFAFVANESPRAAEYAIHL
jgi:hypothetical protein